MGCNQSSMEISKICGMNTGIPKNSHIHGIQLSFTVASALTLVMLIKYAMATSNCQPIRLLVPGC